MNMYDKNNSVIGTKKITNGGGLLKPDGTKGKHIKMDFDRPQMQIESNAPKMISNIANSFRSSQSFPNGMQAPQVKYETPKGDENFSRILRNISAKKNANMIMQYDKMDNSNQQFDREMYYKHQNLKQQQAVKNVMTPYQQHQVSRNEYNDRLKSFDNLYQSNYNDGERSYLSSNEPLLAQVREHYAKSGTMPKLSYNDGGWLGAEKYTINHQQPQQAPVAQAPQQHKIDSAKNDRFKLFVNQRDEEIRNRGL